VGGTRRKDARSDDYGRCSKRMTTMAGAAIDQVPAEPPVCTTRAGEFDTRPARPKWCRAESASGLGLGSVLRARSLPLCRLGSADRHLALSNTSACISERTCWRAKPRPTEGRVRVEHHLEYQRREVEHQGQ
jgi:hypothetical protein